MKARPRPETPPDPGPARGSVMAKARITIRLKPTVLDAQGAVVKNALHSLGFGTVQDVHVGRYVELDLDGSTDQAQVEEMCRKLLANPIIEQYSITLDGEAEK
jgi:phosphoribosylformylglycinamidine synthase